MLLTLVLVLGVSTTAFAAQITRTEEGFHECCYDLHVEGDVDRIGYGEYIVEITTPETDMYNVGNVFFWIMLEPA